MLNVCVYDTSVYTIMASLVTIYKQQVISSRSFKRVFTPQEPNVIWLTFKKLCKVTFKWCSIFIITSIELLTNR